VNNMDEINFTLWHPFTMCVVGPSGCGKTHFVCDLIRNRRAALSEPVAKVIYIYSDYQEIFMRMQAEDPNIIVANRLEELEKVVCNPCLIIVDDFLTELRGEKLQLIKRWFLKHSHHRGASIILLLQNAFAQGLREVSINSHYLVIFDQPRDRSTITTLVRQKVIFCRIVLSAQLWENLLAICSLIFIQRTSSVDFGYDRD